MAEDTRGNLLELRIAELETKLRQVSLGRGGVGGVANFSDGSCTNNCTAACTIGCTKGCTDGCVSNPEDFAVLPAAGQQAQVAGAHQDALDLYQRLAVRPGRGS